MKKSRAPNKWLTPFFRQLYENGFSIKTDINRNFSLELCFCFRFAGFFYRPFIIVVVKIYTVNQKTGH